MTAGAPFPDLPAPLVPAEVDLRGFSGFMLDVDRLLASELVALGTPEECWAAFMLWCRAWKQAPAGSLPQDDRVLAAFSGAGKRWAKVKAMALRGFFKCSDGRLHHPVVAAEVMKAWKKRQQYGADQERLRKWREGKRNGVRNDDETGGETRFTTVSETVTETVREPERQGQGQYITSLRSVSSVLTDGGAASPIDPDPPPKPPSRGRTKPEAVGDNATDAEIERVLFAKGKHVLGPKSGGQLTQLVRANNGSHAQALAIIDLAASKQNPREYVAACIQRGGGRGPPSTLPYDPGL